jgi:ATP-dependent RNA helicase DHR2
MVFRKHTKFDDDASAEDAAPQKDEQKSLKRKRGPQKYASHNRPPKAPQVQIPNHLLKRKEILLPARRALPIWSQAESIRKSLRMNNVLVLTGATGSGKSTQVPQFLLSEKWCTKCIAITQPRRVAAISLARRVAEEMGSLFGSQSPAAKVGYSVRFDNATGPNTKVKFLTEGMLLQEMLRDPSLPQYSAVVVDEVHERSVNVDLILGFLRNLMDDSSNGRKRKETLKIVIMSATADVEALVAFFNESSSEQVGESASSETSWNGISSDTENGVEALSKRSLVSTCFVEGRQYPVRTVYLPEPTQDWVESALKVIFQIHLKEPLSDSKPGDILCFLTGQDTIEALEKLVNDYAQHMDKDIPKVSYSYGSWTSNAEEYAS